MSSLPAAAHKAAIIHPNAPDTKIAGISQTQLYHDIALLSFSMWILLTK